MRNLGRGWQPVKGGEQQTGGGVEGRRHPQKGGNSGQLPLIRVPQETLHRAIETTAFCGADARSPARFAARVVPAPRSASTCTVALVPMCGTPSSAARSAPFDPCPDLRPRPHRDLCSGFVSRRVSGTNLYRNHRNGLQSHRPNPTKRASRPACRPSARTQGSTRFNFRSAEVPSRPVIVRGGECRGPLPGPDSAASEHLKACKATDALQPASNSVRANYARAYNAVAAPYDAFRDAQERVIPQRLGTVQQSLRGSSVAAASLLRRRAAAAP